MIQNMLFEQLGCDVEIIWHKSKEIPADTDLVVIPGGFSYGDYLRSGAIARFAKYYGICKRICI